MTSASCDSRRGRDGRGGGGAQQGGRYCATGAIARPAQDFGVEESIVSETDARTDRESNTGFCTSKFSATNMIRQEDVHERACAPPTQPSQRPPRSPITRLMTRLPCRRSRALRAPVATAISSVQRHVPMPVLALAPEFYHGQDRQLPHHTSCVVVRPLLPLASCLTGNATTLGGRARLPPAEGRPRPCRSARVAVRASASGIGRAAGLSGSIGVRITAGVAGWGSKAMVCALEDVLETGRWDADFGEEWWRGDRGCGTYVTRYGACMLLIYTFCILSGLCSSAIWFSSCF